MASDGEEQCMYRLGSIRIVELVSVVFGTRDLLTTIHTRLAYLDCASNSVFVCGKELGVTSNWSDTSRIGNPVRRDFVAQYMGSI